MRSYAQQKAGLTRAVNRYAKVAKTNHGNEETHERELRAARKVVVAECRRTVAEWESAEWAAAHGVRQGAWPDDWSRWQRALDDSYRWPQAGPRLEELVP